MNSFKLWSQLDIIWFWSLSLDISYYKLTSISNSEKAPRKKLKPVPSLKQCMNHSKLHSMNLSPFYAFISTLLETMMVFLSSFLDEITERQLILIPFWYLTARVLYIFGYLMTTVSGVNLKHYGVTLTIFVYAFMLAKSFGYNLFLYL